jgi:sialate O-acetylesterase
VSSDKVKKPAIVRFAWSNIALPNLMNKDGLPASGFRTNRDNYKLPEGKNIALGKSYISSDKNRHGWDGGLTDGNWNQSKENCFATNESDKFPKEVVVNLKNIYTINGIIIGTPAFGSTKTVKITLSLDGKNYTQVGTVKFSQDIAQKKKLDCNGQNAKFVKLTYTDYYDKKVKYDPRFMFTTEVEVYGCKR